ncbi:hypothetical protein [Fibrella musci]|uniref:hypothetical protein n=1 Tax=Fibrella musci TaxID=3242485 RepID=UPI003521817A
MVAHLTYEGQTIENIPVILDTGAYRCMISPRLIDLLNLPPGEEFDTYSNPQLGEVKTPLYPITFTFADTDYTFTQKCQIMPTMYQFGLLLGTEFLRKFTLHYYGQQRYFELVF